jgi:hypothetical protein
MDYRRMCRWAEWGLVAAVVGLHGAVFFWREDPSRPNFVLTAAHDAQLLSASVLIVGWAALGPGRWWIRLAAAPVLIGLWFLPWNGAMQPREITAGFVGTLFCAAAVVAYGLRACGLRVAPRAATAGPDRGAQFSLLGLLVATTAIAVAIGSLEALRSTIGASRVWDVESGVVALWSRQPMDAGQQARLLIMAVAVALAGQGGVWAVLRPGSIWLRGAALAALIPAAAFYLAHVAGNATGALTTTAQSLGLGLAAVAGWCGVSVLPLRTMNFRLARVLAPAAEAAEGRKNRLGQAAAAIAAVLAAVLMGTAFVRSKARQMNIADVGTFSGRINVLTELSNLSSGDVSRVETPLKAFAQWIDRRNAENFNIALYFAGSVRSLRSASVIRLRSNLLFTGESGHPLFIDAEPGGSAVAAGAWDQKAAPLEDTSHE